MAGSLKQGRAADSKCCGDKADADKPKGVEADFHHLIRCVKKHEQRTGEKLEQQETEKHDAQTGQQSQFKCFYNSGFIFRSEVISKQRHNPLIQTENRHENKGL